LTGAGLNDVEQRLADAVAERREDLIRLLSDLVGFDTTAREPDDPPRDEAKLQEYLAGRLGGAGAEIDLWEPAPHDVAGSRLVPEGGLRFGGRPQLAATLRGTGGGRSLLLNGHIDVVSAEPRERWTSDPFRADVRDGKLYGRGASDMKGGIAAMVLAAETIAGLGIALAGDLVVCTNTDEESTGAGGVACVAHGVKADAGIVTEASKFQVVTACRGSLIPTIAVPGRSGHAGLGQPHWRDGGAVNAIDKATTVVEALRRLEEEWRGRSDNRHPLLSPGQIVPVLISGGEWIVSFPASCSVTYHVAYLPAQADEGGWGNAVEQEIEQCVRRAAATDPWLAENPPTVTWATDVPSSEVPLDQPVVQSLLSAARHLGLPAEIAGSDGWHDGATYTVGGTPCVCFGPPYHGVHAVDEHVVIDDVLACVQALAVAALRFAGSPDPP
jgi:acetylornithine deacetylase